MKLRQAIRRPHPKTPYSSDEFSVEISSGEIGFDEIKNPQKLQGVGKILSCLATEIIYSEALRNGNIAPADFEKALSIYGEERAWLEKNRKSP